MLQITMFFFLLTFLSVYGAMHLYVFLKAKPALHPGSGLTILLAVFLAAMVLAPLGVRLLDRYGLHLCARVLAHIGYTWMGLVFFFFAFGLCLDVLNLGIRLWALLPGSSGGRLAWTGKNAFVFLALGSLLLGVWSMFSAWNIRLDHISLHTRKLPAGKNRLSIAQISDLHLGLLVGEQRLARIIRLVRKAQPDVLVCTGDLVDAQMDRLNHLADMLAEVQPPLGKFAVTGNHEFYMGIRQSEGFLRAAGFTLLRNESYRLDELLTIVGVDDPAGRGRPQGARPAGQGEDVLLSEQNPEMYTLLLKHRPVVQRESLGRFDLQLSGHAHKGQIFPFTLVTQFFYPRQDGLYHLEKGSLLHVSRGTGTWGPPMRFLSPPHVTVIELSRIGK